MKNMFKNLLVAAALLLPLSGIAGGKIQNADVKSLSELQGAVLTTTGNLSSGSACITSPASTTGLVVGLYVYDSTTSTNINSGVTIAGLPGSCSAGQIQMSANAAGSGTGDTIKFGGPVSELINTSKLYDVLNSQQLSVSISNGQLGGSGSKNYVSSYVASLGAGASNPGNGDFEANSTTGWSKFNTTLTSGIPTGSISAGAASITTFAATGTNSLEKKYSLSVAGSGAITAGQGIISDAFYIDSADQAKALAFGLKYNVVSGLANLNLSGTSSNTFAAYLYDVTNSLWVQPAGVYNMVQGSGVGLWNGTFQTSSSGTQYRIAILAVNASAGAASILLDSFSVGPQLTSIAPVASDWFSSTFVTANTAGFGTITSGVYHSRRVGDSLEVAASFTSGSATGTQAQIGLLYNGATVTADVSKIGGSTIIGKAGISTFGATYFNGAALAPSANQSYVNMGIQQTTTSELVAANGSSIAASGNVVELFFVVPIVGWSSNAVSSADSETRVVAVMAIGSSTTIGTGVTTITPTTISNDSHGAFSGSTYTVPVSGYYRMDVFSAGSVQAYTSGTYNVYVRQSGSVTSDYQVGSNRVQASASVALASSGSTIVYCKTGDTLQFGASSAISTASSGFTGSIQRLSGPAVMQANSPIAMTAKTSSQSIASGSDTVVIYTATDGDTVGGYNSSTGEYLVPIAGNYSVSALNEFVSFALTTGQTVRAGVALNGSVQKYLQDFVVPANGTSTWAAGGSTVLMNLKAGDKITTTMFQNGGSSRALSGAGTTNYMSIARIGGI